MLPMEIDNMDEEFDFTTSDFAKLVKTTLFVDNTLMIKDIFSESSRILITAPQQFGKSVNMDMMKRFLEIEMDGGMPKAVRKTTENYKLFRDNKLRICNYKKFFKKHFGRYPVIHIDLQLLSKVHSYEELLQAFGTIILESFNQHRYLLLYEKSEKIDNFDEHNLNRYYSEDRVQKLTEQQIKTSFLLLSRILYRYFDRNVFVLIDNYDAFISSAYLKGRMYIFGNSNSRKYEMMSLVDATLSNLLLNQPCVERALLTGVLPVAGDQSFFSKHDIVCHYFMDGHRFCKYYGLTASELDKVLTKVIKDCRERYRAQKIIDNNYSGYIIQCQNIKLYSIWSVLQYLHKGEAQSYWCNITHWTDSGLRYMFHSNKILCNMEQLLTGDELSLMDALQPISATDLFQMNDTILRGDVYNDESEDILFPTVNTFFILLYHFGYLSITKYLGPRCINVDIPNKEIKCELAKIILHTNEKFHCRSREAVDKLRLAVDLFLPNNFEQHVFFSTLRKAIENWSKQLIEAGDFLTIQLLMILLTRQEYNETTARRASCNGPVIIYLKNKHQVNICIMTKQDTSEQHPTCDTLAECAISASQQIIDCEYREEVHGEPCKLFIGVGYYNRTGERNFGVTLAYSYHDNNLFERKKILPYIVYPFDTFHL